MSYYKIEKLYPWLYSIYDPREVYCYLIIGERSAILFDTGFGVGPLKDTVRQVCDKPCSVILSHGHIDHVNGAYQFDEAWIHPKDLPVYKSHASIETRRDIANSETGIDVQEYINANTDNLKLLEDNQTFQLGNLTAEIVPMEGHTPGSVGLLVKEHRVLFTSDAACSHAWLFLDESLPMSAYIEMLERVKGLAFDTFFVGHQSVGHQSLSYSKPDFDRIIRVAENIDPDKSTPYPTFPELKGLFYDEGDVGIVFRLDKL